MNNQLLVQISQQLADLIALQASSRLDRALASALRQGSSNSLSQTGQQITHRNLNIQPTLTVRPGFPVRVIINRDLVLAAYQG